MAKGIQIMAGDTKCGSLLAIFCIPTHFVGDTLSGATPDPDAVSGYRMPHVWK